LEQEINPKTPPIELKLLPPRLQYVFLNGDQETPVIISDKFSHEETQKLVATLEKYRSVIGYSHNDLKGVSPSLCTHRIPMWRTVATSSVAKLEKTVATSFETKLEKTVAAGFEAKLPKNVATGLRPNRQKPSQQVLRPNR
jgi:hypothetical protein